MAEDKTKTFKAIQRVLTVKKKEYLTPHYIRVTLTADDIAAFSETTVGVNNKIMIPPAGLNEIHFPDFDYEKMEWIHAEEHLRPAVRTYTHRGIDVDKKEMWIDFVAHGDEGPASAWAINAVPGDVLGVLMHAGRTQLYPDAKYYLLVGDATAIPVLSAILETLPPEATGTCVVEVHGVEDEQIIETESGVKIHFIHNKQPQEGSRLEQEVRQLKLPLADVFGYVAAEYETVKGIRNYLRKELGWNRETLYAYSYWKKGASEDGSNRVRREESMHMDA